ncbi:MAG: transporter substrate-binding domain-containing protein [Verrucomicrobiaceae bacterium]|nr:transporter substrate-binding domain-containing protein [Verrucomicrobiaceae bacterium]
MTVVSGCKQQQWPNALVIGTDATYPPFEYTDDRGELAGVDVDLGKALAADLGVPVVFKNIQFDGLIPALQSGSVDIIISSMTDTPERRKSLDFSDPYVTTAICLLVPKASPTKSAEDLKTGKRRVVTKIATTGELWSRANLPNAEVVAFDTDSACVMEVAKGSADAWVYDQISVMNYAMHHPDTTRAILAPIRAEHWAVALPHGQDDLKQKINAFIKKHREAGKFDELAGKYLAKERDFMKAQGIPFLFEVTVR